MARIFQPRIAPFVIAGALQGSGCAKRAPVDSSQQVVRSIGFRGNGDGKEGSRLSLFSGTGDFSLRTAMEQHESPLFASVIRPRQRLVMLNPETLELDAWRIETWYAHHGFFDARVMGWDVRETRPERHFLGWHRPASVRIVGQVREGDPAVIDSVSWEGFEGLGGPLRSLLRESAAVQQGARFDLDALKETEALALERLQQQGYAYASLESHVVVDTESDTVSLRIVAQPGPVCTIGAVSVVGDLPVARHMVTDEIPIEEGQR